MISVKVYSRANVLLDQIPDVIAPKFQEALNETGSGFMTVLVDSIAMTRTPTLLDYGNIVKFTINGHTFAWLIERKKRTLIGDGGKEAVWELSGRGVLALLSDAVVYPELIDAQAEYLPTGTDRWFTYAAADTGWYDAGLWATPEVVVWAADDVADRLSKPVNWPDAAASWMWITDPTAHCSADTVWFRNTLTTTVQERFDLSAVGDDGYSIFVDGQLLMTGSGFDKYQTLRIILGPGEHVFAIQGTNGVAGQAGANPAGVMMTLIEVDTEATEVRLHSSSAWVCVSGNSADVDLPGFNPGRVMADLLAEAVARGVDAASAITTTWTDALDSDGQPWLDRKVNRAFAVGTDLVYVATQLTEQLCFVHMDADLNLSLRVTNTGRDLTTGDTPVELAKANNVLGLDYQGDGSGVKSAVLTLRNSIASSSVDAVADAAYGRRESFVAIGNTDSESQAEAICDWVFEQRGTPSESFAIDIRSVDGAVPFDDFGVGDHVLAPGVDGVMTSFRVAALSADTDAAGNVRFTPELSTWFDQKEVRQARWLASMANGAMGGDVRSASPTHQAFVQTSGDLNSANTTRYDQSESLGYSTSPFVFYLEHYPITLSETIYRNGLKQLPDIDYIRVGKAISMSDVIAADDYMTGHYAYHVVQPAVVEYQIDTAITLDSPSPYGNLNRPERFSVASSPDGRWSVMMLQIGPTEQGNYCGSNVGLQVYRSADGLAWEKLTVTGGPTRINTSVGRVAVANSGKVYAGGQGPPTYTPGGEIYDASPLYVYDGGWSSSQFSYSIWVFLAVSGTDQVLAELASGVAYYGGQPYLSSDGGSTYALVTGIGASGGAAANEMQGAVVLNGWVHHCGQGAWNGGGYDNYYRRGSMSTGTYDAPTTPPTSYGDYYPVSWILPHKDLPSTVYLASRAGSNLYWQRSTDNGENWSLVATFGFPGTMTFIAPTMGSDGKLHVWGYTASAGTVSVREASRNVDGTGSWSAVTTVASHEGTAMLCAARGYPEDGSIPFNPKYAVFNIQNGATQDFWVVNET